MFTAADVFKRARFYLNDTANIYYTDAVLLDPLNIALDDLRGELSDNNIPITNSENVILNIAAGVGIISPSTTPAYPVNMIEIQEILERPSGSNEEFLPMQRLEFLPIGTQPKSQLSVWTWANQSIIFVPATSNRDVALKMIVEVLPPAINAASNIDMIRGLPFLAYRTGALAAENLGEDTERAAALNNNAQRELDKLVNLSVKGKQVMPVRRRPFISGAYSQG